MWDNREGKRNPKAPDFKCKDKNCGGVIWPPRPSTTGPGAQGATAASSSPSCPICGGPMWDDRATKRNPRAPDFKCKNRPRVRGGPGCEGVIWPPRDGSPSPYPSPARPAGERAAPPRDDAPPPDDRDAPAFDDELDDLPF
jgi:hypothetical protein